MKYLFFDIEISGHHTEYIKHLVNYIISLKKDNNLYYFIVHKDFFTQCKSTVDTVKEYNNIKIVGVDEKGLQGRNVKNRFKRSFYNFKLMDKYAKKFIVDIVYLLHLNVFQIALGLKKTNYSIRGILFMQFTNMEINSLRSSYYYLRRYFPFLIMNLNKKLDKIFVLNDEKTADFLNNKYKTTIYSNLPDPINYIEPEQDINVRELYNIPGDSTILFHFGALAYRKGTVETVKALALLPVNNHYTLLLVGKSKDQEFVKELNEEIRRYNGYNNIHCIWDNTFVSNKRVSTLFSQSDIVMMPYKNAEASSGVLGHAIAHKKRVIGTNKGLIGTLINEMEMGELVDFVEPKSIAEAIAKMDTYSINSKKYDYFYKQHAPELFAKKLLCL